MTWSMKSLAGPGTSSPKGRGIYAEICAECHLGPVDDPMFDTQFPGKKFWSSERWKQTNGPDPVLDLIQKDHMGTDPAQANVLVSRKVDVPSFLKIEPVLAKQWRCPDLPASSSTEMLFSLALMSIVDSVSRKWMEDHPGSETQALWGARVNCPNTVWQNRVQYRARPLNGVWATAPYLHNGSVPSLYWLLKPAAERPQKFCIGARDFDPEQVGYRVVAGEAPKCNKGETLFSTTEPETLLSTTKPGPLHGNSALGHSLEGAGSGEPGVVGRALRDDERKDLIEYLKTL